MPTADEPSFGLEEPEESLAATFYDLDSPPPDDEEDEEEEELTEDEIEMREKIEQETYIRAKALAEAIKTYIEAKLNQYGVDRSE